MFRVGQQMAAAIRRPDLPSEGINLFLADGVAAGQEVFHVHLHVIPRWTGDDFRVSCGTQVLEREELDGVAARLRAWL